jgi:hypothetical protein
MGAAPVELLTIVGAGPERLVNCLRRPFDKGLAHEGDIRMREDPEWEAAAKRYIAAKQQADVTAAAMDETKAALVALTSTRSECGCGVSITQFWKRGSVDYKKVPALKGVDLEPYRGAPRLETGVVIS